MVAEVRIESANCSDLFRIREIYAFHVLNGLGTFEEVPPTVENMLERYSKIITGGFPFLVARLNDKVIGYAYASHFRERSAYRFTVEDSVYIDPEYVGKSVGRRLLQELICEAGGRGFKQMFAVIGDSNNFSSINLHKSQGFSLTGVMKNAGYKFNRFVDVVIMQLSLGA